MPIDINIGLYKRLKQIATTAKSSPLSRRWAHGAFWSLIGAVLGRCLGLLSSMLVARMLGKSGFGELGIVQSTIAMLGTFAGFGLGMTATKFIAQFRTTDPAKAGRIRGISSSFAWVSSGAVSLLFFVLAPWLSANTLAAPHLKGMLQIGALILFLSALNGAQVGILSGLEAFKTVAKINLICGLSNFPVMTGLVYVFGLEGAVWGMVLTTAFNWLLNHCAIRSECRKVGIPYTYAGCWAEQSILWHFALPAVISSLFFAPIEWALSAILVNQPAGYAQMGLFNAAKQWHIFILYVPTAISNMTLPILSNLLGEGKFKDYKKMIFLNTVVITGLALIVAIAVALMSRTIMTGYGSEFASGQKVLLLVCVYSVLWAANIVIGQVLWSTGSSSLAMILAGLRAAILLGSFVFLAPKNAYGIALAYTITYVLQTAYQGALAAVKVRKHARIEGPAFCSSEGLHDNALLNETE